LLAGGGQSTRCNGEAGQLLGRSLSKP
jgi:hypothetical protein